MEVFLLLHDEPIFKKNEIVCYTTSSNFSFYYKKNICLAYIKSEIEDKEEDTNQIAAQIDLTEYHYKESDYFFANIFDKMNIQINDDIKLNVFARMRINEYLKDMEKLRDDIETIFEYFKKEDS